MLHHISKLPQDSVFLLGFSGGVDSSALFFLLLECGVEFDLAIVDYGMREESRLEVAYAQELAQTYDKKIYHLRAPRIGSNFEANARKIRYEFFGELIAKNAYRGLLLAHQLNDRIEWLLMQFARGAGLNTLLGFGFCERVMGFDVFRPLLDVSKGELYRFCMERGIRFFEDRSNQDERFVRNRYRMIASFLMQSSCGIKQSLKYLEKEKQILYPKFEIGKLGEVRRFARAREYQSLYILDLECKKLGYVLSAKQKKEIMRCCFSCEIHTLIIESNAHYIFVTPKIECVMSREYRNLCRIHQIPHRLRPVFYPLWCSQISIEEIGKFCNHPISN
ncbi:tRNA lysidine(34) synthetase TilS [Helicobacter pametensis]|uniref:tRNA lysidine(34) synthetase TilS n=1 Tax=Helicobacter pametensis TaxID=95149 RepID=UPI0004860C12|nr:tRNA lysidine(34) synthetase TilS [Helicobacter pametensis]